MNLPNSSVLLRRLVETDLAISRSCNRFVHNKAIRRFFSIISRLGDGVFWYSLSLVIPLIYGLKGLETSIHMALTGLVTVVVYKAIKTLTERKRPCDLSSQIFPGVAPLDQYSFPSGHTMHAMSFSVVAINFHPELGWLLVPFSSCVAMSRLVLGLHFPTDVVIGAAIGSSLASLILII
jgi:undecaprenyl-diphosphatase